MLDLLISSTDTAQIATNQLRIRSVLEVCYRQVIDMLHGTRFMSFFRGYTVEYTVSIRYTMSKS